MSAQKATDPKQGKKRKGKKLLIQKNATHWLI